MANGSHVICFLLLRIIIPPERDRGVNRETLVLELRSELKLDNFPVTTIDFPGT